MDYIHVYPVNDLIEHNTNFKDEFGFCICNPRIDGLLVVHASMDRRECFETPPTTPTKEV
jgi:hypothetical protein